MFGYALIAIWVVGAYLLLSIKRPNRDEGILAIACMFWPLALLIKLSDMIHSKYWSKKAFQKYRSK